MDNEFQRRYMELMGEAQGQGIKPKGFKMWLVQKLMDTEADQGRIEQLLQLRDRQLASLVGMMTFKKTSPFL